MRRATHLLLLTLLLWLPAGAAHADPAGPTNYDSRITDAPDTPGVTFDVFGGDAEHGVGIFLVRAEIGGMQPDVGRLADAEDLRHRLQ